MKKMYKKLVLKAIILTSIFVIFPFVGKNYKSVYAAPLSGEEIMQKEIDSLRQENKELREKNLEVDKELGKKYFEIDKEVYKIKTTAAIFLSILSTIVGGSGISIYKINKKISEKVNKEVNAKVRREVSTKIKREVNKKVPLEVKNKVAERIGKETKRVEAMIDDLKKDETLMDETKIIVISYNDQEENESKTLLKQFKRTQFERLDYALGNLEKLRGYDVIFFNDINGYIEDKDMKEIVQKNSNHQAVYFYFNKRDLREKKKVDTEKNSPSSRTKTFNYEGSENINFAKSNATLCGNLLDLMRYQEDILKNKK